MIQIDFIYQNGGGVHLRCPKSKKVSVTTIDCLDQIATEIF